MTEGAAFERLKARQRALREDPGLPRTLDLRVHRALSWLKRAEQEADDPDARFLFLWIGFNAAYAEERDFVRPGERDAFREYFGKLIGLDGGERVYDAIWERFAGPVRTLLDNRYVYQPYWHHANGIPGNEDWEARLAAERQRLHRALARRDTLTILACVFGRLYVLRNQLVHGGATWGGGVNRAQVQDGARILAFLLPLFLDTMLDHPDADWGRPFYPVME